jgi:hypothetical protein
MLGLVMRPSNMAWLLVVPAVFVIIGLVARSPRGLLDRFGIRRRQIPELELDPFANSISETPDASPAPREVQGIGLDSATHVREVVDERDRRRRLDET